MIFIKDRSLKREISKFKRIINYQLINYNITIILEYSKIFFKLKKEIFK
jgi:hypothetical protein